MGRGLGVDMGVGEGAGGGGGSLEVGEGSGSGGGVISRGFQVLRSGAGQRSAEAETGLDFLCVCPKPIVRCVGNLHWHSSKPEKNRKH